MTSLSKRFPDVQYFGTYRVEEYHGWARAINGKIVRQYAYWGSEGETIFDIGKPTDEEERLGLIFNGDTTFPHEGDVMKLAGAWSIDPTTLHQIVAETGIGYLGLYPEN
jgi:hypothetical protein